MNDLHDQLAAYVDGELDADQSEAFARHLAGCATCRDTLHDVLQLVALEAECRTASPPVVVASHAARARAIPPAPPGVLPRAALVSRRWRRAAVAIAAAAIAVAVWWQYTRRAPVEAPPLASATARAIEGRISYAALDHHRPYDVVRSPGGIAIDTIAFDRFAELERRGDLHGVAAASLLVGDLTRAAAYLERAAPGPDVATDSALLQLATGHPRDALITLDGVLAAAPSHPQALWNRALALRDLGLARSAAEAFETVALLGEPGWAAEARARAHQLAEQSREQVAAFERLATVDGPRLASVPGGVAPEIARRFPGTARIMLYEAVRGARSAAAVRDLAPLARTLDAVYGSTMLAEYVERIARADFAVRAPAAARYAEATAGAPLDPAARRALLSAIRATGADDILLGALVVTTGQGAVDPAQTAELSRLAGATGDPWLELLATERAVASLRARGDHAAAEAMALPGLARCDSMRLEYRCASLALSLGESYVHAIRLTDARNLLAAYLGRVRRAGEWYQESSFLALLAQIEVLSDDVAGTTLPVARAYVRELVLREPAVCDYEVWGHELVALLLVNRIDLDGARAELASAEAAISRCAPASPGDATRSVENLFVAAHVLRPRTAGAPGDIARVRAQIDRARSAAGPGMRAMLDHIEGRLLLDRDRVAATQLLQRAIAGADVARDGDANGPRARAYAYSLLALDAARAGEWDRVWTLLEAAARRPPVSRCALGVAAEDGVAVVVARDPSGASHGVFRAARAASVPAEMVDALRGCPEVAVLARPPAQGVPELLPAELAWSYRLDAVPATPEIPASAQEPSPSHRARVVIANAEPPPLLGVTRLAPWSSAEPPEVRLEGPSATPSRALQELAGATFVEIHAHGMVSVSGTDASFVMLSPDPDGRYALTAAAIRRQRLRGRPIVVLAACRAANTASYRHEAWSLPAAFVDAGARAVIASTGVIDDGAAGAFFDDVRARIERGASPEIALRDTRAVYLGLHPSAAWVRALMVFR